MRRIEEYEGTVDLILSPRFATEREGSLVVRFQEERVAEFREVFSPPCGSCATCYMGWIPTSSGFPDVSNLESELGRLHRWYEQDSGPRLLRGAGVGAASKEILAKCDEAFERFASTASDRVEASERKTEDVFERLGGKASPEPVPEDYPL